MNPADEYVEWVESNGGLAKEMTMRDVVALFCLPFVDADSNEEAVDMAFSLADAFMVRRER